MILTDREIAISIARNLIIVDPCPDPSSYSSTSIDLTLASQGAEWQPAPGQPIRPGADGYSYFETENRKFVVEVTGYTIRSRSFFLAWTREYVKLPIDSKIAARIEGKSSLARLGLGVHLTAPTIHAGFEGQIQLEMFNFGPNDIILDAGMKIGQLIFEMTAGTPDKGYSGIFEGQTSEI